MIFQQPPEDFNCTFKISSCFVEYNNELLFLLRNAEKDEGNKYGIPTGRIEQSENHLEAMLRELREETGIAAAANDLMFLGESFVRFPDIYDFKAYVYYLALPEKPEIIINPLEHQEFWWSAKETSFSLPLVKDLDNWIKHFLK